MTAGVDSTFATSGCAIYRHQLAPADTNWAVAWHRDRTFPVRERVQAAGYGPWAMKHGVPHVELPAELLQRLVTLRHHLDDCTADNPALKVIPGSWRAGRLDDGAVVGDASWYPDTGSVTIRAERRRFAYLSGLGVAVANVDAARLHERLGFLPLSTQMTKPLD